MRHLRTYLALFLIIFFLMITSFVWAQTSKMIGMESLGGGSVYSINEDGSRYERLIDLSSPQNPEFTTLIENEGIFYGMTSEGGADNDGTIFSINSDGSEFTILHHFNSNEPGSNVNDGANPMGSLVLHEGKLWGLTAAGGGDLSYEGVGIIFSINLDGTNFEVVYNFKDGVGKSFGSLIVSNGKLWGMTQGYGLSGCTNCFGTIFSLDPTTGEFTIVHYFDEANGSQPIGDLLEHDGKFWGFSSGGGTNDEGVIFSLNNDGSGFEKVYDFGGFNGKIPSGNLILSNGKFWGLTSSGGDFNDGVIFSIDTNGTGYTKIHDFNGAEGGGKPYGSLYEVNDVLWGIVTRGSYLSSSSLYGAIFSIQNDGTDFAYEADLTSEYSNLLSGPLGDGPRGSFLSYNGSLFAMTRKGGIMSFNIEGKELSIFHELENLNGSIPFGSLIESNDKLWGMASEGGIHSKGVIFSLDSDGTNYTKIHDFDGESGSNPHGDLVEIEDKLWGMTSTGGTDNKGIVFYINTDGTGFTKVLDFIGVNGSTPYGNLTLSNGKIWGLTYQGGVNLTGVIFNLDLDGTGINILKEFSYSGPYYPLGTLLESNGRLWGTSKNGGSNLGGSIFGIDTDGSNFENVYDLNGGLARGDIIENNDKLWFLRSVINAEYLAEIITLNTDGTNPLAVYHLQDMDAGYPNGTLVESSGILWGFTKSGTFFNIKNDGTGFTVLEKSVDQPVVSNPVGSLLPKVVNESPRLINGMLTATEDDDPIILSLVDYFSDDSGEPNTLTFELGDLSNEGLFTNVSISNGELTIDLGQDSYGQSDINIIATDILGKQGIGQFRLMVEGVPDTPNITTSSTTYGSQTSTGLEISRNESDGDEVTYFQITEITNGKLFRNDGITEIVNDDFIPFSEASMGLKFTPSSAGSGSFIVQSATGTLIENLGGEEVLAEITIDKADLTVRADDKSMVFSETVPELTFTISGFVNDEGIENVLSLPVLNTDASPTSTVGDYPIVVTGGEADNYNFQHLNGTLSVIKADQEISFDLAASLSISFESVTLEGTTSSGLPLTYSSSNESVVTIENNVATLLDIGDVTITALQEGNDNYNAAQPVDRVLTVLEPLGIYDKNGALKMKVYPNPTDALITIAWDELNSTEYDIRIYNIGGFEIDFKILKVNHGEILLDLGDNTTGVYLLSVDIDEETVFNRIQKK